MPIKIPDDLPAKETLVKEGVEIIPEGRAARQDIRPLQIAILNLMPEKITTETQLARLLGYSPLQIELTLLQTASYQGKTTPLPHLQRFYLTHEEVARQKFDGVIVTGAPIEHLPFSDVLYWPELCRFFDWTQSHAHSCFFICWGAQAALKHFYGVEKHALEAKSFGVFRHQNLQPSFVLMRGLNDSFPVPVSRYTEVREEELAAHPELMALASSPDTGLCLVTDARKRHFFMFNHMEYDADTLANEYFRDQKKGMNTAIPVNYFPDDDPSQAPQNQWLSHAHVLFSNWINLVYQTTPFERERIQDMESRLG